MTTFVALYNKLSEFLKGRAAQMLQFVRQDYEKERLFSSTDSDELYNDIRMAEEMKEQRNSGRRPDQKEKQNVQLVDSATDSSK